MGSQIHAAMPVGHTGHGQVAGQAQFVVAQVYYHIANSRTCNRIDQNHVPDIGTWSIIRIPFPYLQKRVDRVDPLFIHQ